VVRALRSSCTGRLRLGRVRRGVASGRESGGAEQQPPSPSTEGGGTKASAPPQPPVSRLRLLFRPGRLFGFAVLGSSAAVLAAWVADPEGTRERIERLRHDIESRVRYYVEPSREKLLPDPISAYPGVPAPRTLVLDLDETLVHSEWSRSTGWRTSKRPGVDAFLAYMAQFYEIVVFTSALPGYADPILDRMDPNGYITHRLYRHETKYRDGLHVKDLAKLNRDLRRTIIIDNDARGFSLQPENGIEIASWNGTEPDDKELLRLTAFLEWIVRNDVEDVRTVIGSVRNCDRTASRSFVDKFEACRSQVESLVAAQRIAAAASASADAYSQGKSQRAPSRGLGLFTHSRRDTSEPTATTEPQTGSPPAPAQAVPEQSIWSRLRR
jgi:Dullard-like phosphatase family protein